MSDKVISRRFHQIIHQQRTAGVRAVIERLRRQPNCILGLTPKGMDSPAGGLALPPAGAGRFMLIAPTGPLLR